MSKNSNKEIKKDKKFMSEEEFNKELKKQVDNLKKIFDDNKKESREDEEC